MHQVGRSPKVNSWELLWQNFYRPDALPVTQTTVLKDDSVPDWGQHTATKLPRYVKNIVMVVWAQAALPSGFKAVSFLSQITTK